MPEECQKYRLQLIMEHNRVLAWGKAAGLLRHPRRFKSGRDAGDQRHRARRHPGSDPVATRRVQRDQLALRQRAEPVSHRGGQEIGRATGDGYRYREPGIQPRCLLREEEKEPRFLRGTNRILGFFEKVARNTKEIATHPSRVRWVVVDQEAFQALLEDLHVLSERLHELMRGYREKKIDEITAKTYREMILARNDIKDLKEMIDAAASLVSTSSHIRGAALGAHENSTSLQDLAQLKKISRTSEVILSKLSGDEDFDVEKSLEEIGVTVQRYTPEGFKTDLAWNEDEDYPEDMLRPRAILTTKEGDVPVWIEWKTLEGIRAGSPRDKESKLRTVALAEMLHIQKPRSLFLPTCVGYFDDREISGANQYGWIFRMPDGADYDTSVKSLFDILGQVRYRPTLAGRIALASRLASSLLNLHTANWLHKGMMSENILFYLDHDEFDLESPLLSGFEYSRPERDGTGATQTTGRHLNPQGDIYRWPYIQRESPRDRNSRKDVRHLQPGTGPARDCALEAAARDPKAAQLAGCAGVGVQENTWLAARGGAGCSLRGRQSRGGAASRGWRQVLACRDEMPRGARGEGVWR